MDQIALVREYIWKFFDLHANQRIALFRFYIGFCSLYLYGMSYIIIKIPQKQNDEEILGIILTILFMFITFIFHLLDMRNMKLISDAKSSLKYLESKINLPDTTNDELNNIKIFIKDDINHKGCFDQICTHTSCFRMVFFVAYGVGLIFLYIALRRICLCS